MSDAPSAPKNDIFGEACASTASSKKTMPHPCTLSEQQHHTLPCAGPIVSQAWSLGAARSVTISPYRRRCRALGRAERPWAGSSCGAWPTWPPAGWLHRPLGGGTWRGTQPRPQAAQDGEMGPRRCAPMFGLPASKAATQLVRDVSSFAKLRPAVRGCAAVM